MPDVKMDVGGVRSTQGERMILTGISKTRY
jgi:hypothetical protein